MSAPIFITGAGRSGTSLMLLMMQSFADVRVYPKEMHPLNKPSSYFDITNVMKQPIGYWEQFSPKYTIGDIRALGYRVLCMIRDPKDILVSHHAGYPECKYWVRRKDAKRSFREIAQAMGDERVCFVRYETLVSDLHGEMERVGKFFGLTLESDPSRFYTTHDAKSYSALNGARPVDTNSIGNWKNHTEYLEGIWDNELNSLTTLLGYEPLGVTAWT